MNMSAGEDNKRGSGQITPDLDKYFYDIPANCPYGLPSMALYHQALLGRVPDRVMERFMAAGFRRSGNNLYTMLCPECRQCVPIRIDPLQFRPSRSQRRAWGRNGDVAARAVPLQATDEKLAVCNRFLRARYPGRGNSADEYYFGFFMSSITNTYEIEYRLPDGRLLGVAVVDAGAAWLNAVYFYFDPEESRRSPGTFNILHLLEFCREWQIGRLYLGYWIKEVDAMRYKARFLPHELLLDRQWTPVRPPPSTSRR
ncbi:MAG: arginyltransferase [Desulfobacteraceae bacterium]|nr:arginyltransferase [Desulfobacteraceae bacterium]